VELSYAVKNIINKFTCAYFDFLEPSLVLHCLKVPRFLQRMEKRAREREEKHAIIRERRRQMEEERIRLKQQVSSLWLRKYLIYLLSVDIPWYLVFLSQGKC
jgi:hypothetical protein